MKHYTFDEIQEKNLLIYNYLRGSHCHGISTPQSDEDYGGVYLAPVEQILGIGLDYQNQISNETSDIVWYELQRFMTLLLKSNPTILEALFVDDKYVRYEHPIMTEIKSHRDLFLTKKCFDSFFSYSKSQIKKARGLKKKINWDIPERKTILDFCYTFYKQGSTKITNWLEYRNLSTKYCGLVNIPNMFHIYGAYYDWGNHFLHEDVSCDSLIESYLSSEESTPTTEIIHRTKLGETGLDDELRRSQFSNMVYFIIDFYGLEGASKQETAENIKVWYNEQKPIGYRGMTNEANTSDELRLSSVSKGMSPICYVSYYKDAYSQHCKVWKEYQEWVNRRNPVRYESNLNKSYDAKNMCECFRLINCGIEIANGEGFNVDRTGIDAKFLLDVKNHKYEYEELMEMLGNKTKEMETAMANSKIPDDIDSEFVNDILIGIRRKQLGIS